MIGKLKWFSPAMAIPNGTSQNERFAERLDSVWFKHPQGSRVVRLGRLLTNIINEVTSVRERLKKLEEAAEPTTPVLPMRHSSAGRTATGVLASNNEALRKFRLPSYLTPTHVPDELEKSILDTLRRVKYGSSHLAIMHISGLKVTIERDGQ